MQKRIQHILGGREKYITAEEKVLQPLPHKDFRFANPFIVLHHLGPDTIEAGQKLRINPHPHRGFAPVTFQLQGEGYHKDNAGHDETISAGDVQWMFAGKGLLHSEGPTQRLLDKGGTQELIQLWVNVPAANKWDAPSYQSAKKDTLPKAIQQEGVELRIASGNYNGFEGPIKSFTPITSLIGELAKGTRVQLNATQGYWALLYIISGKILINCETIDAHNLLVFEKENEEIILSADEDTQILFLSAEPILEAVAAKDNFVMNTQEEIQQAFADYKNGIFGTLNF